jgi:IS1 family transposase
MLGHVYTDAWQTWTDDDHGNSDVATGLSGVDVASMARIYADTRMQVSRLARKSKLICWNRSSLILSLQAKTSGLPA